MSQPPDGSVLNFVIRMVVPLRREFGRSLDVQQFMRDPVYARMVLEEAAASRDQRLRDYAEYVKRHLHGAREVDAPHGDTVPGVLGRAEGPPTIEPLPPTAPAAAPAAKPASAEPTEAELRARLLKKYTTGLR